MLQAVVPESSWIGELQGLGASRAAIVGTPGLGGWQESSHQVGPWLGMLESWGGRKKPQKLQGSGLLEAWTAEFKPSTDLSCWHGSDKP